MKDKPPLREQALQLMVAHPNLIKRPILIGRSGMVLGFQQEEMLRLL